MVKRSIVIILALISYTCSVNFAHAQDTNNQELADFSLEELMDVEVVSISRKAESIQGAAAAVFVISAEDIRRSGVHSIPEALRLAPGVNVARINASSWAITSRGFNSRFANKLQVLVDGRSVYSPMFSGVYWEDSSVMVEDIERIEIIRGPGATMWGANAVNGVINIITTRPDPDAPESFASVMAGTETPYRLTGRVDGTAGENGAWRLSAQAKSTGTTVMESGEESYDAWTEQLARVRYDRQLGDKDNLSISSHYFHGDMEHQYLNITPTAPYTEIRSGKVDFITASLQTIWAREISETAGMQLGLYFTHFDRKEFLLAEKHHIIDADFQNNFNASPNHAVIWGGSWRYYQDELVGLPAIFFDPDATFERTFSAFAQDDWAVVPDHLHLILGGKWEYREDTGSQWQPSARIAWTPSEKATWWGSVARAVRVPSRINRHVQMDMTMLPPGLMGPDSPPISISMVGSMDMVPEELVAYETGFRIKPAGNLSLDLALFINDYDNLRTLDMGAPRPHPVHGFPTMMMPFTVGNGPGGRTQGGELAANWKATSKCQFQLAYSYWDFKPADPEPDKDTGMERLATPKHQVSLRGLFNPAKNWEADVWFRFTDDLMADQVDMAKWSELDLRLAWTPTARLSVAFGGRNLLNDNHQEFIYSSAAPNPAFIQRSGYGEIRWSF